MQNRSLICLFSLAAAGCAGSHAEQVRDARMERVEARAEAKEDSAENRAEQREDRIAKRYDAREERVEQADRPTEDADSELIGLARERTEFRSQIQTKMETLATRINADQQKIQVLGPRAPTNLHSELDSVAEQYRLLKHDVVQLEDVPDTSWGDKRSAIEHQAGLLDERVSKLSDAIAQH